MKYAIKKQNVSFQETLLSDIIELRKFQEIGTSNVLDPYPKLSKALKWSSNLDNESAR
jgi:hypothetical protein